MNIKLQTYVESFAMLVVLTLLFSLIFSALYYFQWISYSTFHLLNITSAYLYLWMLWFMAWKTYKKESTPSHLWNTSSYRNIIFLIMG